MAYERLPEGRPPEAASPAPTRTAPALADLTAGLGNQALQRRPATARMRPVVATEADARLTLELRRAVIARDGPDGGVAQDAGVKDAGPADMATLETYSIPTDAAAQRRAMEELAAEKGPDAPREFLDGFQMALIRATPDAGIPENADQIERAKEALTTLEKVVGDFEADVGLAISGFETDGRTVLGDLLTESETRAKAEGIKYGLTQHEVEILATDPMGGAVLPETVTDYDMPGSPAGKGLAEAANQLLTRRKEAITPLEDKKNELMQAWMDAMPSDEFGPIPDKPAGLDETEAKLKDQELQYDVLAAELAGRYPILGSFTAKKGDLSALQTLAAGPSKGAAQLIGSQIAETLGKIQKVRAENMPGGDVDVFALGKVVALTKARRSIADGTWQAKAIEAHIEEKQSRSTLIDIALGLLNLVLVVLAPATGGATLIAAAGLSTATAVMHAQQYMLEDAMAGSDVDKAHALSQDEPSLFWLAVDIVAAAVDVGQGAAAAAKLMGTFRAAVPSVHAAQAARTAKELEEAKAALRTALEKEPAVLDKVLKTLEQKAAPAATKELDAVDKAVAAGEAQLKGPAKVTGEIRAEYSDVLASEKGKEPLAKLEAIEADAAKPGADANALTAQAVKLEETLAEAALRARAEKIAAWLPTAAADVPALAQHPLDVEAVMRLIQKTDVQHIKGQLLEELMGAKVQGMLKAGDKAGLAALGGERAAADGVEYIGGHRIKDARGKQFTDGILAIRDGDKIEVIAILESKAGKPASRGLGAKWASLKQDGSYKTLAELAADPSEEASALAEARREAIQDLQVAKPKQYGTLKLAEIDAAPEAQQDLAKILDDMIKTEDGQAVQDIERTVSVGMKIDDKPVQVTKGGRASTKVVGVLPTDVDAAAIQDKVAGQGVNFGTADVSMDSKEIRSLANQIATKAKEP